MTSVENMFELQKNSEYEEKSGRQVYYVEYQGKYYLAKIYGFWDVKQPRNRQEEASLLKEWIPGEDAEGFDCESLRSEIRKNGGTFDDVYIVRDGVVVYSI